jgi:hypothetical protein
MAKSKPKSVAKPKIVVGVPGSWPSRSEIVTNIASRSGGYIFAGMILMEVETQDAFALEIYDHDPRMREAFAVAGGGRFTDAELDAIGNHTHTLYVSADGGSSEAAWRVMRAVRGLILAGGLGAKVESAGLAIRPEVWLEWADSDFLPNLYHAFVVRVGDDSGWFSCGMHNLGYRDVILDTNSATPQEAGELIHGFQMYELLEQPKLVSGQTFSLSAEAPAYRFTAEKCETYPPDDPFHNPYGMWRMTRVVR